MKMNQNKEIFQRIWELIYECRTDKPVTLDKSKFIKGLQELENEYSRTK